MWTNNVREVSPRVKVNLSLANPWFNLSMEQSTLNAIYIFGLQGRWFWCQSKGLMSFPIVINSTLGPISHHFWNTVTYWLKIAMFRTFVIQRPRSHCRISGKALRTLEVESNLWQPTMKILWSKLASFWYNYCREWRTNRQTDTQREKDRRLDDS